MGTGGEEEAGRGKIEGVARWQPLKPDSLDTQRLGPLGAIFEYRSVGKRTAHGPRLAVVGLSTYIAGASSGEWEFVNVPPAPARSWVTHFNRVNYRV